MPKRGWVPLYYEEDEVVDRMRAKWGQTAHVRVDVAPWDRLAGKIAPGKRVALSTNACMTEARVVYCVIVQQWPRGKRKQFAGGEWVPMELVLESRPMMDVPEMAYANGIA